MYKKPNFLIVGGAKCGSTSLYHYLNQHYQVFMPVNKEPNFFVSEYQLKTSKDCPTYKVDRKRMVFEEEEYFELYKDASDRHKAIGEATVTYLYKPDFAIPKIKQYLGDPKIIIILRNPVRRAFSHYSYVCELGFESEDFSKAINIEEERLRRNWSSTFAYLDQGRFYSQVKAYQESFSNVHILILEEFAVDKQSHLTDIYKFLGIDSDFQNSFEEEHNVSGVPKLKAFQKFLVHDNFVKNFIRAMLSPFISTDKMRSMARKARSLNQGDKMKLSDDMRRLLEEEYTNEVSKIEKLLKRNIDAWN